MYQGTEKICRLSDYLRHRPGHQVEVMDHECQIAFLNWVAYHPLSNNGKPYDHLSCPLTRCPRNGFGDFESYLQHVANCQFLPDATYRCPYHNLDECFAASALRYGRPTKDQKHSKDSKVRDAVVSFFKHFGRKKDLSHEHKLQTDTPSPRYHSDLQVTGLIDHKTAIDWPYDLQVGYLAPTFNFGLTPEICTMDHRGSHIPMSFELPTWCHQPELPGAMNYVPRIEMSGTRSYVRRSDGTGSDNHKDPTGHASISSELSKNWSEKGPASPHSALTSPKPLHDYSSESPAHHQLHTSNYSITGMEYCETEQRWGKIPGTSPVPSPENTSLPSDLESGMLRGQTDYGSVTPRVRQDLRLDIPQMVPGTIEKLPLNAEAVPDPLAVTLNHQDVYHGLTHFGDRQSSVEELSQIGDGLEDVWVRKLKASPELSSITSQLQGAPALQSGLRILKQLFESKVDVPRTTEDLLPLMLIAFACAYVSYSADGWYDWEAIYQDILRWSQTIAEPDDRARYFQVAELLWSAPENMTPSMDVHLFENYDPCLGTVQSEIGFASYHPGVGGALSTGQQGAIPFEEAYDGIIALEQLRKGVVVKSCARYLNGTQPS